MGRGYTLYQRQKAQKKYWYVQFYKEGTRIRSSAVSIDVLAERLGNKPTHITSEAVARRIADKAIETGLAGGRKEDPLFLDFLNEYWDFDNSKYIQRANINEANTINRDYAYNMRSCVKNHVAPYLPSGLRCSQVKQSHIEALQEKIVKDSSVNVWVSTLKCLRAPINELKRKQILINNPLDGLFRFKTPSAVSPVGSLTEEEVKKLISQMYEDSTSGYTIKVRQNGPNKTLVEEDYRVLLDKRVLLAVCLSAETGMRKGEILGLRTSDISFPNQGKESEAKAIITIRRSYARHQGMKSPKSKRERMVPVPRWLALELIALSDTKKDMGNDLIFFSAKDESKPIDLKVLNVWFNKELARIGIDEETRRKRNITFHSLRHYAVSMMRTRLGDEKTQQIIGHTSTAMTNWYDTATDEKIKRTIGYGQEFDSLIINPAETESQTEG